MPVEIIKAITALPGVLKANAIYLLRVGTGFSLFVADATGATAHAINAPTPQRQVDIITASGSVSVPAWARKVTITAIGGGASGGSGGAGTNAADRFGGGGGGAGALVELEFDRTELGATLDVVIGAGGTSVPGVTGTSNGTIGNSGSDTTVSSNGAALAVAQGGQRGAGGSTNGNGGVASAQSWPKSEGAGGNSSATANPAQSPTTAILPSGGGPGGGLSLAGVQRTGGASGSASWALGVSKRTTGGSAGAIAAAGGPGNNKITPMGCGSGGGGGGAGTTSVNGGNGGAGGIPGGGGGGGGATRDNATSGASGAGARGEVWLVWES